MDKGLALKAGGSLASAAALAGGSYLVYDSLNPSLVSKLSSKGYRWSPVTSDIILIKESFSLSSVEAETKNIWTNKDCAKNFFPRISEFNKTSTDQISDIPIGELPNIKEEELGLGCFVFSAGKNDDSTVGEGLVTWELALKKGDYGVLIKGFFQNSIFLNSYEGLFKTDNLSFTWSLVQLKKEGEQWKPLGGAKWNDITFVFDTNGSQSLKLNFPHEETFTWNSNLVKCALDGQKNSENRKICSGPDNWSYYNLSAYWQENQDQNNEGKQVFDILDWRNNNNQPTDLWGNKDFQFSISHSKDRGWKAADYVLDLDDKVWKSFKDNAFNATNFLEQAYSPFSLKKGTWYSVSDFCSANINIRNNKDEFLETKIQSICMTK